MTSTDTQINNDVLCHAQRQSSLQAQTSSRTGLYSAVFKRVLDVLLLLLSLPIVLPVIALLAFLVALDGGSPFYSQMRVGRNGRHYRMWKLRSMVPDADALLESHLAADPAARAEWDAMQKLRCDPRITRIGAFIRKTSLDELPQLFNVLTGAMSLVGPRPMMANQEPLYPGNAYFELRPGITGPWQISDRNNSTFSARAEYDADYLQTLSFTNDVRILTATVRVVASGTGC